MKKTYKDRKNQAREKAQILQVYNDAMSWQEVAEQGAQLEKLAKRYGLVKEFKENSII